jgi:hypothetical protein
MEPGRGWKGAETLGLAHQMVEQIDKFGYNMVTGTVAGIGLFGPGSPSS